MNIKRLLCIVLTSPVWLLAGFLMATIGAAMYIAVHGAMLIEYGFTGRWDD